MDTLCSTRSKWTWWWYLKNFEGFTLGV
jgi:hypothetical protein